MFTCGWCGTHYLKWQSHCDSCGGPLPLPAGAELGPEPPPAPRELPRGFEWQVKWSKNVLAIIGAVFAVIGLIQTIVFARAMPFAVIFTSIFLAVGLVIFGVARRRAGRVLRAFKQGRPARGKISEVYRDTTVAINNRNPYRIVYHFTADGRVVEDYVQAWDASAPERQSGQAVWVLYVEDDPTQNTLYPPVK